MDALQHAENLQKEVVEHKKLDDALERERNILKTTINTLPVLVYFKDTESRFVTANEATAKMMGAAVPEDLVGKTDMDYYPPDIAEKFIADEREIIQTGKSLLNIEERVKTVSGEMRWLLTSKVPIFDGSGKVQGLIGTGRDITERKLSDEALRQEKALGDTIIDTVPGLFYVLDKQGRYLRWSKTQEELSGKTSDQMWHLDVFSTIHEEDRERLVQAMTQVFTVGHIESEARVLTKDGSRHFYFTARKMALGNEEYIIGTGIDITDRKIAEEALVVSEESYRAIFNTASDAIFVHDIETGQIIDINDKACEMFIYPKEELLRLSVENISLGEPPYTQSDMLAFIGKAARGEPQLFEWVAKDKAQRTFWVEVNLKRAVIGGKYRILAIVRDITERKRSEERWTKIHETFLNFGADPDENINRLTALCGELLGADCALYNRLEDGNLHACGQWHAPADFVSIDSGKGHICFDVIASGSDGVVVVRDLQQTDYAQTDPNVSKYNLQTYAGRAVRVGSSYTGSLCVVFQYDCDPNDEDKEIMGFIALAIGIEEERRSAEEVSQIAQFAIERSTDAIFWAAPDGRYLYVNEVACSSLGYTKEELLNMTIHDINPDFKKEEWLAQWKDLKERMFIGMETRHRRKDGTIFPVDVTVNYLEFKGSEYSFTHARDITERKKQEAELLRRDYQLEVLSRTSQHINAVLDTSVILRTLIGAAIELVDATAGTAGVMVSGKMYFNEYNRDGKLIPIDYAFKTGEGLCGCVSKSLKTHMSNDIENDPNFSEDMRKAFDLYNVIGIPILNHEGALMGCMEIHNKKDRQPFDAQDVFMLQGLAASAAIALENANSLAQRDEARKALEWQKNYYEKLLNEANVWIEAIDNDARLVLWNKKAEEITGYKREEIVGSIKKWSLLYTDPSYRNKIMRLSKKLITSGKTIKDMETEVTISNGEKRMMSWSSNIIRDSDGKIIGSMFIGNDITERKRIEKEREFLDKEIVKSNKRLQQLALKDAQTGLYNHHYLSEVIEPEFYRAKRYGHPLSLIMIDIDYFKSVNDLYGHEFGDLVLKQFAKYLRRLVRKYDIVVRFGGEEFIILSAGTDRTKALALAQRLLESISLYNFGDKKHIIKLKLSIAVAAHPDDTIAKGMDLVDRADKILEKAKEAGGNTAYTTADIKKGKKGSLEGADIVFLKEKIAKLTRRGKQSLIESIFAFAKTLEMRDHYTGKHAESTVYYSTEIAKALNLSREETDHVKQAAVLHDLGKIGISDKILHKKSKLSPKEYEEIKKHPQIAADIIRPIQFMHDIIPFILYHHERWDGKGYPAGLKSEEIPIGARIISIADVYQALTSNRPYRKAFSKKEAMKIIKEGAGTQFDPVIVKAFLGILAKEKNV